MLRMASTNSLRPFPQGTGTKPPMKLWGHEVMHNRASWTLFCIDCLEPPGALWITHRPIISWQWCCHDAGIQTFIHFLEKSGFSRRFSILATRNCAKVLHVIDVSHSFSFSASENIDISILLTTLLDRKCIVFDFFFFVNVYALQWLLFIKHMTSSQLLFSTKILEVNQIQKKTNSQLWCCRKGWDTLAVAQQWLLKHLTAAAQRSAPPDGDHRA